MNVTSFDKAEDRAYAYVDGKNGVVDNKTYMESLSRPRSDVYVVMPDGSIQFLR